MMDDNTMSNQTGKLTEKQKEILEKRKKELENSLSGSSIVIQIGVFISLIILLGYSYVVFVVIGPDILESDVIVIAIVFVFYLVGAIMCFAPAGLFSLIDNLTSNTEEKKKELKEIEFQLAGE